MHRAGCGFVQTASDGNGDDLEDVLGARAHDANAQITIHFLADAAVAFSGDYPAYCWINFAIRPVHPVWWLAPIPAPLSP
jgi:hypothetical protein